MKNKILHALNPFNGTPFKTAAIHAVLCALFVSVTLTLMPVVFGGGSGGYHPITSYTNPQLPETVHIGETFKGTRTICVSDDTFTTVTAYWVQVFPDGSQGQPIKTQTDVPYTRKKGCTDIERLSTPPQGIVPGVWRVYGKEVAASSKSETQTISLESNEVEVLP